MRELHLALIHHPVLDRAGSTVTTAITNLDLHDIARSARTYGAASYLIVHPVTAQRELVARVRDHWLTGSGGRRIPDRQPAMERLHAVDNLEAAIDRVGAPEVWSTSALRGDVPHELARRRLREPGPPVLLLFGTGWGLAPEAEARAQAMLEPIHSPADDYNHLSVRAAAAILLDRLCGAPR